MRLGFGMGMGMRLVMAMGVSVEPWCWIWVLLARLLAHSMHARMPKLLLLLLQGQQ